MIVNGRIILKIYPVLGDGENIRLNNIDHFIDGSITIKLFMQRINKLLAAIRL